MKYPSGWTFSQLALLLVLCACGGNLTNDDVLQSVASFTDTDITQARDESTQAVSLQGSEEGDLPDDDVLDLASSVSAQAVLPATGGFVAYVRHEPTSTTPWQVWLANQANDAKTKVYAGNLQIQSVAVNQDGKTLLVAMKPVATGTNYDVYRIVVGAGVTKLTTTTTAESNVSISADGQTQVWEGTNSATAKRAVFIKSASGTKMLADSASQTQPTVSGDGLAVAFVRYPVSGKYAVMRYHRSLNSYLSITTSSLPLVHPSLSNGGAKVAWLERSTTKDTVRVKTLSSGSLTTVLSVAAGSTDHPHLTADGVLLTYSLKQGSVWGVAAKNLTSGATAQTVPVASGINVYAPYWQKSAKVAAVGQINTVLSSSQGIAVIDTGPQQIKVTVNKQGTTTPTPGIEVSSVTVPTGALVWTNSKDGKYVPEAQFLPLSTTLKSASTDLEPQFLPAAIYLGLSLYSAGTALYDMYQDPPWEQVTTYPGVTKTCLTGSFNDLIDFAPVSKIKSAFTFMRFAKGLKSNGREAAQKVVATKLRNIKDQDALSAAEEEALSTGLSQVGFLEQERHVFCMTDGVPVVDVRDPNDGNTTGMLTFDQPDLPNGKGTITTTIGRGTIRIGEGPLLITQKTVLTHSQPPPCQPAYRDSQVFGNSESFVDVYVMTNRGPAADIYGPGNGLEASPSYLLMPGYKTLTETRENDGKCKHTETYLVGITVQTADVDWAQAPQGCFYPVLSTASWGHPKNISGTWARFCINPVY